VNEFRRLLGYTRPYRGRLAAAFAAMIVYGAATGYLAKLIKDIVDDVLVKHHRVLEVTSVLIAIYLAKGVGA
jgi:subfamily B ATP-binding cassette protein MsbA